jgi:PmbA protein
MWEGADMAGHDAIDLALRALKDAGANEAQASLSSSEVSELNVDAGAMSLLRTTRDAQLALVALAGKRRGAVTINRTDPDSIRKAAETALALAKAGPEDDANAISPPGIEGNFAWGEEAANLDAMYDSMKGFLAAARERFPLANLEQCILDFNRSRKCLGNSNGVRLDEDSGLYAFSAVFTSKDGEKTSSMNYTGACRRRLDLPLLEWGGLEGLLAQSAGQLEPKGLGAKFEGDLIISPHCLPDFISAVANVCLGDSALIAGTSPWKDSLGTKVSSQLFSLASRPTSDEIAASSFFTPDGFIAADCPLIEDGVLRNYMLGLYGARKSGKPRCPSGGQAWVVDAGEGSCADLVKGVERGILLCRFSGGDPNEAGDFSGVAKNSYYIEDGRLKWPLCETMIAGNILRLLEGIKAVSRERIDFGHQVLPWLRAGGVTASGK